MTKAFLDHVAGSDLIKELTPNPKVEETLLIEVKAIIEEGAKAKVEGEAEVKVDNEGEEAEVEVTEIKVKEEVEAKSNEDHIVEVEQIEDHIPDQQKGETVLKGERNVEHEANLQATHLFHIMPIKSEKLIELIEPN